MYILAKHVDLWLLWKYSDKNHERYDKKSQSFLFSIHECFMNEVFHSFIHSAFQQWNVLLISVRCFFISAVCACMCVSNIITDNLLYTYMKYQGKSLATKKVELLQNALVFLRTFSKLKSVFPFWNSLCVRKGTIFSVVKYKKKIKNAEINWIHEILLEKSEVLELTHISTIPGLPNNNSRCFQSL